MMIPDSYSLLKYLSFKYQQAYIFSGWKKGPGQQLSSRALGGGPERERKAVDSVSEPGTLRVNLISCDVLENWRKVTSNDWCRPGLYKAYIVFIDDQKPRVFLLSYWGPGVLLTFGKAGGQCSTVFSPV